jgi:hypothetical protein
MWERINFSVLRNGKFSYVEQELGFSVLKHGKDFIGGTGIEFFHATTWKIFICEKELIFPCSDTERIL